MRIAFSGTANSGKSTLLDSFLHTWKNFETPEKTYRDFIKEENLEHSTLSTTDTQTSIMNHMIDTQLKYGKDSKVVYDRCPLDCLAYTLWCNEKGKDDFTSEYVKDQIALCRESMRSIDIIFLCKFDSKQKIEDNGNREIDLKYITEIDNIFGSLYEQYNQHSDANVFYPKDDSPAIIVLPNDMQSRVNLIAEYITPDGGMYGEEESILNPNNLTELEQLVNQQQGALDADNKEKELFRQFGLGKDVGKDKFDLGIGKDIGRGNPFLKN